MAMILPFQKIRRRILYWRNLFESTNSKMCHKDALQVSRKDSGTDLQSFTIVGRSVSRSRHRMFVSPHPRVSDACRANVHHHLWNSQRIQHCVCTRSLTDWTSTQEIWPLFLNVAAAVVYHSKKNWTLFSNPPVAAEAFPGKGLLTGSPGKFGVKHAVFPMIPSVDCV